MLFDFERPHDRTITETILTLAGLSKFVIADISNPRSSPLELHATMPVLQIPFVPVLASGEEPFSMFHDLISSHSTEWGGNLLPIREYPTVEVLMRNFDEHVIGPALAVSNDLVARKNAPTSAVQLR